MGNPIDPIRGVKHERVSTGLRLGGWELEFHYDSAVKAPVENEDIRPADPTPRVLGPMWSSSFHRKVIWQQASSSHGNKLHARGDGRVIQSKWDGGQYVAAAGVRDRVMSSGRYFDAEKNALEYYDNTGSYHLLHMQSSRGRYIKMEYSSNSTPATVAPASGYLVSASDETGRVLQFRYELPGGAPVTSGGRLVEVFDNAGPSITIGYNGNGNVERITWADGRARQYLYEHSNLPWALTGVVDESGMRYSTFGYDAAGRAISTERARGVDRYQVSYAVPPKIVMAETLAPEVYLVRTYDWSPPEGVVVTDALGNRRTLGSTLLSGKLYLTSRSQTACEGCTTVTMTQAFDSGGNLESKDDFTGRRACYAHDLSRNLEITRVEGLSNTATCGTYVASGAALPSGSRKVSTQWHSDWRLETRVAEPGRIVTTVYNGQPDPFSGGAVASCAPSSALLPDGKPIAVVCKRVEQATTDANGSQGFSASLAAGVPA
ncbi:hypothetical protein M8A51_25855, partial [Schlegelella sp. S2-27]|nr:hypothetical protein [Caldimonas mangrovi]